MSQIQDIKGTATSSGPDDAALESEDEGWPLQTVAIAGAAVLVILPVLYRIGLGSSIIVIVLAVSLNAVPDTRTILDSFFGRTPSGRHRLANNDDTLRRKSSSDVDTFRQAPVQEEKYIELQVGPQLQQPMSKLLDLIMRDFVEFWYNTSIALSPATPFPTHTRSMLNSTINNLSERMRRQEPKEVSIYLFHSASSALITGVRESKSPSPKPDIHEEREKKDQLLGKVRRTSEELLLTLAPRSITSSNLTLSLLSEIVSLQIWATINSINADWINQAIVQNFGEVVELAEEVRQQAKKHEESKRSGGGVEASPDPPAAAVSSSTGATPAVPSENAPPALPPRTLDKGKGRAVDVASRRSDTIDMSDPNIAASSLPFVYTGNPTLASPSGARSPEAGTSSQLSSRRQSLGAPAAEHFSDKTLEDAFEQGATKLRTFGKNLFSAGTKLLDAALPADETTGLNSNKPKSSHTRGSSLGLTSGLFSSVAGDIVGPSAKAKGKERERDDPHEISSPTTTSRPASVHSRMTTGSSSKPSSSSRPSSVYSVASPSAASIPLSPTGSTVGVTFANLPSATRAQRVLDSFKEGPREQHERLIKSLEHSLFSRDLSLLFPPTQDSQLKAVLARHTSAQEIVDPTLVEVSDAFHSYLERDQSGAGEKLLRLWTQLDHFNYMVEMTRPTEQQLRDDALALLRKVIGPTLDLNGLAKTVTGPEGEKAYWTALEIVILRLEQPTRETFEPLQDWLLREIEQKYWLGFVNSNPRMSSMSKALNLPTTASNGQRYSPKVPTPSTSKHTLDYMSANGTNNEPQNDDFDLGSSMSARDDEDSVGMPPSSSSKSLASASTPPPPAAASTLPSIDTVLDTQAEFSGTATASPAPIEEQPAPPSFAISLTDLSPPSAYHNSHVKNRKELEFLIAVEVDGSPGYILARKYVEFEQMDAGIKKALPQSGTKSFPRAPLPSTNFQTSENLCHSLEHYLDALLQDDRYASSDPVGRFFAKERTGSKGDAQPLAFLGRGVNNIGKGMTKGIVQTGDFATKGITTGFNQITGAVTSIPGLRRRESGAYEGSNSDSPKKRGSVQLPNPLSPPMNPQAKTSQTSLLSETASLDSSAVTPIAESSESPTVKQAERMIAAARSTNAEPPESAERPASPEGYEVPSLPPRPSDPTSDVEEEEVPTVPAGFHYQPRKKTALSRSRASSRHNSRPASRAPSPTRVASPTSPGLRGRMSFDELVAKDQVLRDKEDENRKMQEEAAAIARKDNLAPAPSDVTSRAPSPVTAFTLSPNEFNNVLSFAMAILEEAYDLVDSTWNIKRGILKVLETLLRTSYAGVIKAAVTKLVTTASQEDFYASNINALRKSFWPEPDNLWWSSVPGAVQTERTAEQKEATRIEARRLILLQAPEGLKVSLGQAATAEAFGRLHDAVQGEGAERLVSALVLDYLRLLLL